MRTFLAFFLFVSTCIASGIKESDRIEPYLNLSSAAGFSGVVLVARGEEVILQKAYGLSDRANGISNTVDTPIELGSITKHFTASAIMKLEMQGKLATTDTITKYFDSVPKDKAGITIHQLLSHTAGLGEYSGDDYDTSPRDETMRRILDTPLEFEPGTAFAYSNPGFSVLAAIVEIASGKPYEAYLNENLFAPAGMKRTGYRLPKWDRKTMMHGYVDGEDQGTVLDRNWSETGPYWNLFGNGGIISTVGDMYLWKKALKSEKILSGEAIRKMFTVNKSFYGYGSAVHESKYGTVVGHGGANDLGFNASFNWYLKHDLLIVVGSNIGQYQQSGEASALIGVKLGELLMGPAQTIPEFRIAKLSQNMLQPYEGDYALPAGGRFRVQKSQEGLTLTPVNQEALNLMIPGTSEEKQKLTGLTARSAAIVEQLIRGEFTLLQESTAPEKAVRYRGYWGDMWKEQIEQNGAFQGYEIPGTTFTWWDTEDWLATIVRLKFEKGDRVFRFHWKEGKIVGLGGQGIKNPAASLLLPLGDSDFLAWHLVISNPLKVRFVTSSADKTIQLVFLSEKGEPSVRAQRVPSL